MRKLFLEILAVVLICSLILGGCGEPTGKTTAPTTPPTTPAEKEMITITLEKLDGTVVEKTVEKPQYGGTLTYAIGTGSDMYTPQAEILHRFGGTKVGGLTNEKLITGNFYRSQAGTDEFTYNYGSFFPLEMQTGLLAESWEFVDHETLRYHIRPGILWSDGSEFTAHDVVNYYTWGYEDQLNKYGATIITPEEAWPTSITALDDHTVEFKSRAAGELIYNLDRFGRMWPIEFLENLSPETEWMESIGTGPFVVTEYVADGWTTLVRNPNYWREDPLIPGNKLPYVETVGIQVIPDTATRLAALRTGQIDMWDPCDHTITPDTKDELLNQNPDLQYSAIKGSSPPLVSFRTDIPPYDDIRVRKALSMAINREEIVRDLYGGEAEIYSWPVNPDSEFVDAFTPFEDLPEATQEQFDYNPEKARELLSEALGHDNGFEASIVLLSDDVDVMSLVIGYWEAIGVHVTLDVKERGAYLGLKQTRGYEHMFLTSLPNNKPTEVITMVAGPTNNSMVEDAWLDEKNAEVAAMKTDYLGCANMFKEEINPYILSNVWYVSLPTPDYFQFWQPWVKRYHGEMQIGNNERGNAPIYVWIDQDLKAEMLGEQPPTTTHFVKETPTPTVTTPPPTLPEGATINWDESRDYLGMTGTVTGTVANLVDKGNFIAKYHLYLGEEFGGTIAVIEYFNADKFPSLEDYVGKEVEVTGEIVLNTYEDLPEIYCNDPSQIVVVGE